MKINPKSNEELQSAGLIEPGVYNFEVTTAVDTVSKSGNDMIKLQIKVWDKSGSEKVIFDYLLDAMAFKLRHFAESTGLIDKYNYGELMAHDCIGKCGKVELLIEKGPHNPNGGMYPDKNTVKDYVLAKTGEMPIKIDPNFDDTIPF